MDVFSLLNRAQVAKRSSGKGLINQLLEIIRLRKGDGQLGTSEYFDYRLFDDNQFDEGAKQAFVGWKGESPINNHFNKYSWAVLSLDKIVFYTFLEGAGIPYPKVKAILSPGGRFLKGAKALTSPELFADYLRDTSVYPLFAKPSHGNFGRGSFLLSHFDASEDAVVFFDQSRTPVSQFSEELETLLSRGYLFQEVFTPPPELAEICASRSSTVRISVAVDNQGPRLHSAVWKVPTGNNVIDNFQHGRTGNLVASVNVQNGQVVRVIGQGEKGEFTEVTQHPDTGHTLNPLTLPYWQDIERLCVSSAKVLPEMRLLHFDIALSDAGPLLLEVNFRGNLDLHQHASGKGFLTPSLRTAMVDQDSAKQHLKDIVAQTRREQSGGKGA